MTRPILLRIVALAGAALALSACGHGSPTRFYTLEPAPPSAARGAYAGPVLQLDAVRLPATLDRMELMTEVGAGQLKVEEFERWAAPPARMARAALNEDLTQRLPPGRVALLDTRPLPGARRLSVTVLSFSLRSGIGSLSAGWTLGCPGAPDPAPHRADLQSPEPGHSSAAFADLLGRLSDRITTDVEAGPYDACPMPPLAPPPTIRLPRAPLATRP